MKSQNPSNMLDNVVCMSSMIKSEFPCPAKKWFLSHCGVYTVAVNDSDGIQFYLNFNVRFWHCLHLPTLQD